MAHPPRKKKLFETAFKVKDLACFPVFNFFKSCFNSSRPDWGPRIVQFKIPGSPARPAQQRARSLLNTLRKD